MRMYLYVHHVKSSIVHNYIQQSQITDDTIKS